MTRSTTGGRGRSTALAAFAVLILVGALLLGWALSRQQGDPPVPDDASGLAAAAPTEPSAEPVTPRPTPPDAGATAASATAPDETAPAETEPDATAPRATASGGQPTEDSTERVALPPSEPVSLRIPAIEVTSDLHPLGLTEDGRLAVPSGARYDQAAWYDDSPTPGEVGPSVIEGHVTSQGSTPSVFFELGALRVGETVEVTRADGTVAVFEIYASDRFPKDAFPKAAVYGNTDRPELRIITCGGEYDPAARSHVDNIVVFAVLVGAR